MYQVRRTNDEFRAEWDDALAGYGDDLEAEALRRAVLEAITYVVRQRVTWSLPEGFPRWDAAWQKLSAHAQALRRTGSTAVNLAYVACGRFDGYWAYDNYAWDVAAGVVLVREAGGTVTGVHGGDYDPFRMDITATNGAIHAELVAALVR